jgi:hypothetical protein
MNLFPGIAVAGTFVVGWLVAHISKYGRQTHPWEVTILLFVWKRVRGVQSGKPG